MKKHKYECLVCAAAVEEDDFVYAMRDKETLVFPLCGEHALVVARFLDRSGLVDRTSIRWKEVLEDSARRRNKFNEEL